MQWLCMKWQPCDMYYTKLAECIAAYQIDQCGEIVGYYPMDLHVWL